MPPTPANNDGFIVNPFTLVFDALWSILENSPQFTADVKAGNRIHLNRTNDPNALKPEIQDSDLPEVILTSAGSGTIGLFVTSSTSKIIKRYQFLISTGDQRVQNYLNQVQFDIFAAFTGWQDLLGQLIWPVNSGRNFVKRGDLVDCEEGLSNSERNRGIVGWSSIWSAEVEMHFATSDLKAYRGY